MDRRIFKWVLSLVDEQTIRVPTGTKFLDVQIQDGACCVWGLCETVRQYEDRKIFIVGTGNPVPDNVGNYIGTIQLHTGALVFHVFEGQL